MTHDSLALALSLALVPAVLITCGGDVVVDPSGPGSGGAGASSPNGSSVNSSSSTGGVPTSPASVGPSTSTGPCVRCAEALRLGFNPAPPLCPDSQPIYDALQTCVCATQCPFPCGDNVCAGDEPDDSCIECVGSLCNNEFAVCVNDV